MSIITAAHRGWSWVLRGNQPARWCEADAEALTVAGVTAIHAHPRTVRTVITETQRIHGGVEGVRQALETLRAGDKRTRTHTQRRLDWARQFLAGVSPS